MASTFIPTMQTANANSPGGVGGYGAQPPPVPFGLGAPQQPQMPMGMTGQLPAANSNQAMAQMLAQSLQAPAQAAPAPVAPSS